MKITLFTSDKIRHNYLIQLLSNASDELFVIQEKSKNVSDVIPDNYIQSETIKNYFQNVVSAQKKIFGEEQNYKNLKNVKILSITSGSLSNISLKGLDNFLNSDMYVVFGSSYIKNELVNFLIKKKAINIHMGISPYYRGTDCNFWALFDGNAHLVGSTIHLLSKGLDNGPILYHAISNLKTNTFEYTMSTVKSAFHSISERIINKTILSINPIVQDNSKEIRYSKKKDFNEKTINEFLKKEINLNAKDFDRTMLKDPYFLEK